MLRWLSAVIAVGALMAGGPAGADIDITAFLEERSACQTPSCRRLTAWKMSLMTQEFPHSEAAALEAIATAYPGVTEDTVRQWLQRPDTAAVVIDGRRRYFSGVVQNFGFRNLTHLRKKLRDDGAGSPFVDQLKAIVCAPVDGPPWRPYTRPVDWEATVTLTIPRKSLPEDGAVQLWVPLPVQTGSQINPRLTSLEPSAFVGAVPRMDGNMGCAFFDIPVAKLAGELDCRAAFTFTSYRQHFRIDPDKVLPYDKEQHGYRRYTRSRFNTTVTPRIESEARRAVGKETNPYLMARRLYDHIVDNYPYSLLPHATLQILGISEAGHVQSVGHGDCGAQSMLFAAMCRSLGIPARSIGGYQMITGRASTHFWAEFYLEGYGWVPVDVTVAETADWTGAITESERQRFKAFFFGNLDPYRYIIQKDVDLPLTPRPAETVLNAHTPPIVVQGPFIVCPACSENPFDILDAHYRIDIRPASGVH